MALPVRRSTGKTSRGSSPTTGYDDMFLPVDRLVQWALGGSPTGPWLPAADVTETDDAYLVEVELPGVRREDVDVELNGNELAVSGEIKERERQGLFRRRTRRVGEFEYHVTLPGDLSSEGVEATLANGVLTVRVPKAESAKPRRIEITDRG